MKVIIQITTIFLLVGLLNAQETCTPAVTIPPGSSTSFENTETYKLEDRWVNAWPKKLLRKWRIRTGPTPTGETGPDQAQDGNSYLYYEGSAGVPALEPFMRRGDIARLFSPAEFEGCFCFSFWCHMKTDGEARLRMYTTSGIRLMDTANVVSGWLHQNVTINMGTDRGGIIFEAVRGKSELADMALDNFKFYKGACQ